MTALHLVHAGPSRAAGTTLLDDDVAFPWAGHAPAGTAVADDLAAHLGRYGPRPAAAGRDGDALLEAMSRVVLTGRGGGHFPSAVKWRGAVAAGARTVVANGAEGEPASAKDAALLTLRPHLVLDGLAAAAEYLGADDAVVWLHAGAHAATRAVARAVQERLTAGVVDPPFRIVHGPDHYLTGQASAVLRALRGGPALPETVRDPAAPWNDGPPALLHNVETLARVGVLARTGAEAYRATSLVTVVTPGLRMVREVPTGTTVAELLDDHPDVVGPQAVLIGGYGGRWVRWDDAGHLPLDPVALSAAGLSLGAGVVAPLDRSACGLEETSRIVRYLAASSARQCGPCLFGLDAIADLTERLAGRGLRRGDRRLLARHLGEVEGRGACAHPDGAVRLLASALDVFADDVEAHRRGGCTHQHGAGSTGPLLPVPSVTSAVRS